MAADFNNFVLKKVQVKNYKSFQDVTVNFGNGLNILIGKNGVGKSNLLDFISRFVSFSTLFGPRSRGFNFDFEYTLDFKQLNKQNQLVVKFEKTKRNTKDGIEFINGITLSKKVSGKYVYIDKKFSFSDRDIRRNDRTELRKETEVLRRFSRFYIRYELPKSLFWVSIQNKLVIDKENFISSDSEFSGLSFFSEFDAIIEFELFESFTFHFNETDFDQIRKKNC